MIYYDDSEVQDLCQEKEDAWGIVMGRSDAAQAIKGYSEEVLSDFLRNSCLNWTGVKDTSKAAVIKQLPKKWHSEEKTCKEIRVWYLAHGYLEEIGSLIEKGFDPRLISRKHALEQLSRYIGAASNNDWEASDFHRSDFHTFKRSTVKVLAARGFPIDCDSVPVIDDEYCQW